MAGYAVKVAGLHIDGVAIAGTLKGREPQARVDRVASAVKAMQVSLCPVDTGNMVSHIEIRKTPDGLGRQIGVFVVDYALPVEFGHEVRDTGKFVPAQPFIRPSVDAARAVFKERN